MNKRTENPNSTRMPQPKYALGRTQRSEVHRYTQRIPSHEPSVAQLTEGGTDRHCFNQDTTWWLEDPLGRRRCSTYRKFNAVSLPFGRTLLSGCRRAEYLHKRSFPTKRRNPVPRQLVPDKSRCPVSPDVARRLSFASRMSNPIFLVDWPCFLFTALLTIVPDVSSRRLVHTAGADFYTTGSH